jgi:hypothetical protein
MSALPPVPAAGMLVARLEVDAARLSEVSAALAAGPIILQGSGIRPREPGASFDGEVYLAYARVEDLRAALRRLVELSRGVRPLRAWCKACAAWHDVDDAERMRVPEGAPCRRGTPPLG